MHRQRRSPPQGELSRNGAREGVYGLFDNSKFRRGVIDPGASKSGSGDSADRQLRRSAIDVDAIGSVRHVQEKNVGFTPIERGPR
jgi:hypothetical protein